MSSMSIKELGSMLSKSIATTAGTSGRQADSVSFESVWNNQTEKNNSAEVEVSDNKTAKKDDTTVRDSLKSKEVRKDSVKDTVKDTDKVQMKKPDELDQKELEQALEVLGTVATQMIQQIAEEFDMTVEEVQSIMADLGMEQLDVLQQGKLGELLLAVAGVDDTMALLTDGDLYQKYQTLMEEMSAQMEQCAEELQMPVDSLEELVDVLPIEVTVDDDVSIEEDSASENILLTEEQDSVDGMNNVAGTQNGQQMQNQTEGRADSEDKGQNVNLVLQNLKNQSFEPQLQQVNQTTLAWDMDTMDIMKQIMDYMKIQVKPDMSHLEMQLHPESLGTLQVNVAAKDGAVTAQFITQNEAVKAVLESQMIQLKESFAEQGVKVESIEVTVQTHQFERNLDQGRGSSNQGENERKGRTRRINLNALDGLEDREEMTPEEALAAEMMTANGNTVDYTA